MPRIEQQWFAAYSRGEVCAEIDTYQRVVKRIRHLGRAFLEAEQGERAIGCEQAARMLEDELTSRFPADVVARGGLRGGKAHDPVAKPNSREDLGY